MAIKVRDDGTVETDINSRLDRLPWSRFHVLVVVALGITWVLDGLEVTIVGSLGGVLMDKDTLDLSASEIGAAGSAYLIGAVTGAIFFGWLTDRLGRKKLFMVTLIVYAVGAVLTAFSFNFWTFALFRFITGTGIGGEYSAINSAIDELMPARLRGRLDLVINGSYWLGALFGAALAFVLLDPQIISNTLGWRLCFMLGATLAIIIVFARRSIPESPRWLITHGRSDEAEKTINEIEARVLADSKVAELPPPEGKPLVIEPRKSIGFGMIAKTMFKTYPKRSTVGLSLMVSQAFLYNGIFFTYALVLTDFYDINQDLVPLFLMPFAVGNFLGPVVLGRYFDTVGRRKMIALTYTGSAVLLTITGLLFVGDVLNAVTQTIAWTVVFFVASPAASSAYLSVSEIFPLETRALAIAFFYAIGTAAGGPLASWLFGAMIETKDPINVFYTYLIGAILMVIAAGVEWVWGIDAEGKSLEDISKPLTMVEPEPI